MQHSFPGLARILLGLLCLIQAIATIVIDLNRTHATNPLWLRHARFHLVWQTFSGALLSLFEAALAWAPGSFVKQRFYLAVTLTTIPLLGFMIAFASRKKYGGALSDPNGIPPVRVTFLGRVLQVDGNFAAVVAALGMLILIVTLYCW